MNEDAKTIISDKEWDYRKKNFLPIKGFERLSSFKKRACLKNPNFILLKKTMWQILEARRILGKDIFPEVTKIK